MKIKTLVPFFLLFFFIFYLVFALFISSLLAPHHFVKQLFISIPWGLSVCLRFLLFISLSIWPSRVYLSLSRCFYLSFRESHLIF